MSKRSHLSSLILRGIFVAASAALFSPAYAANNINLVKPESVAAQKKATKTVVLDSGVTVIIRRVPDSGISTISVGFPEGSANQPSGRKVLNDWSMSSMGRAAKGYSKEKLNKLTERYSIGIGCGGGVEFSQCSMTALSSYWGQAFPAFVAVVMNPVFDPVDVKLQKDRMEASFKGMSEDPGSWSNDVVNRVYYPAGHPYRLLRDEALGELAALGRDDLVAYHKSLLAGPPPVIVVVSDMPDEKVLADVKKIFGNWSGKKRDAAAVTAPSFDSSNAFAMEERDIPTAYIKMKFPAIGAAGKDATASRLVFEMLSEELWDEVRTRKSLSYGVGAAQIQYRVGIGAISVSTSKPQETMDAIAAVIQRLKTKRFSQVEVDRFKVVFSTSYFMTQETHGGIAGALLSTFNYYGSTDRLYEMPADLERVTPEDIQRIANDIFKQMRIGVVYAKGKFNPTWATAFNDKVK